MIEKRWDLLKRFFLSGAIVTLLVVALPWFVYAIQHHGLEMFLRELRNTAEGGDHANSVLEYIAVLTWGAGPWSFALPFALSEHQKDGKPIGVFGECLLWIACIAIPLLLNGNKQKHYLLPMLPAIMILVASWSRCLLEAVQIGDNCCLDTGNRPAAGTLIVPRMISNPARTVASGFSRTTVTLICGFMVKTTALCCRSTCGSGFRLWKAMVPSRHFHEATLLIIGKQGRPIVAPPLPFTLLEQFDEAGQTYALYRRR